MRRLNKEALWEDGAVTEGRLSPVMALVRQLS